MKKVIAKIIRAFMVVLAQLPLKFHYFMGDIFSWIVYRLVGYRVGTVWMNISRAFPEKKYWALSDICREFYRHFGEIVAEMIWFGGSSYKRLSAQKLVTVRNPEVLEDIYVSSPSVTLLCTHCGNWELLGGLIGYLNDAGGKSVIEEKNVTVVYKKLTSEISNYVFAKNRMAPLPVKYKECEVESMNVLRFSIQKKNEKRLYIYPADQAPNRGMSRHDIGIFLNQQTYAMTGSVGVACKLSHAVVYMKMRHVERGRYEMEFIPICPDASKSSVDEIIKEYYRLLEEEVRETPHNWLWSHNRWKMN